MEKSKTTQKKTATKQAPKADPVESVAVAQPLGHRPLATSGTQEPARRKPSAARRVPVQYTPRIPSARCPGC